MVAVDSCGKDLRDLNVNQPSEEGRHPLPPERPVWHPLHWVQKARILAPGVLVCGVIALSSTFLSEHYGGPQLLYALLIGLAFHFIHGNPKAKAGIEFCGRTVLRVGVALLGVRITFNQVLQLGVEVALVILVTYFVVFVERGQRKILVNYARRQVGNKVYGGQSSHLPLKLNMAGVIPPIFASSIILLPTTIVSWVSTGESTRWLRDIASALSPGQPIYVALYAAAIVFFCFFYTALVFNSRETADNLKKSGAFIPGIRPGDQTARYIDKILLRLTLAGAVYITAVCLLPEFLILEYNVPFYFGGTSLLIIVVVTMDFMAQVQNYLMSQQYESLLKKANFKTSLGN
mgnify:CR=1 FL=1